MKVRAFLTRDVQGRCLVSAALWCTLFYLYILDVLNDLRPALRAVYELILAISDDFMSQSLILTLTAFSYDLFAILVL